MSFRFHFIFKMTLSVLGWVAFASASLADNRISDVAKLVKQLDSNSREERLAAERELIRQGGKVLPDLPAPEAKLPVGVQGALMRIRTEIEMEEAVRSLRPGRVSLKGSYSLKEALKGLENQTSNTMKADVSREILEKSFLLGVDDATYWECIEQICRTWRLQLEVPLGKAPFLQPAIASRNIPSGLNTADSARIAWEGVELLANADPGKEPDGVRCRLSLSLEPRLRGLYCTFLPRDCQLMAGNGVLLTPVNPQATFEFPFGEGGKTISIPIDFRLPQGLQGETYQLKGSCAVEVAAGAERIEFGNLNNPVTQMKRSGSVTVTMTPEGEEEASENFRISLLVRYDTSGPSFESHRLWIFNNQTFLRSGGREIEPMGVETILHQGRLVGLDYMFSLPRNERAEATFVYHAPTRIVSHPVKFGFSPIRNIIFQPDGKQKSQSSGEKIRNEKILD